jgi:hypothetical protein
MLDFTELPDDGQLFEQLIRETLFALGLHVEWSGRGPDGGRDILCRDQLHGTIGSRPFIWLVQCKHFAHANRSVGVNDLDNIVDSCVQHGADGYLLACSTQPSSAVVNRLEAISAGRNAVLEAKYWDAVQIERLLSHSRRWSVAQRFFPRSAGEWLIYATEEPNDFIAHYRGYVFHLTNRIDSDVGMHLQSIARRISEIESIALPEGHFIRPRCVWYNGKSPEYIWYIDYMRPHKEPIALTRAEIQYALKDGWALEDGQLYSWDVSLIEYFPYSDHYDRDHYDYYTRYIPNFLAGRPRPTDRDWGKYYADKQRVEELDAEVSKIKDEAFDALVSAFNSLPFLRVLSASNAQIEELHKFDRRYNWEDILQELNFQSGNFFAAEFVLRATDTKRLYELFEAMPIDLGRVFRLSNAIIYVPETGRSKENDIYDLSISCVPAAVSNQWDYRKEINGYMADLASAVTQFVGK